MIAVLREAAAVEELINLDNTKCLIEVWPHKSTWGYLIIRIIILSISSMIT